MKYETKTTTLSNGNTFTYAISENGTCFTKSCKLKDAEETEDYTDENLWEVIDRLIKTRDRVRVWYGNKKTGEAWNEEYDVTGYIGRSFGGSLNCPLMIPNSRSFGGPALLDSCVIRIDVIETRQTVYKVENFHTDAFKILDADAELQKKGYTTTVIHKKDEDMDFSIIANFKTRKSAENYVAFMEGRRYAK